MQTIAGMKIVLSPYAVKATRNWPPAERRSARLRKKMEKKRGPEIFKTPCAFKVGPTLFCHPDFYAELVHQTGGAA